MASSGAIQQQRYGISQQCLPMAPRIRRELKLVEVIILYLLRVLLNGLQIIYCTSAPPFLSKLMQQYTLSLFTALLPRASDGCVQLLSLLSLLQGNSPILNGNRRFFVKPNLQFTHETMSIFYFWIKCETIMRNWKSKGKDSSHDSHHYSGLEASEIDLYTVSLSTVNRVTFIINHLPTYSCTCMASQWPKPAFQQQSICQSIANA